MTQYAEEVRNQYLSWLEKPQKALDVLRERGENKEAIERISAEIKEVKGLISKVHGDMYSPATPGNDVNIHLDIITKCASFDIDDALMPIYAELDILEKEKSRQQLIPSNAPKQRSFFLGWFSRRKKNGNCISAKTEQPKLEQQTSNIDECVEKFKELLRQIKESRMCWDIDYINRYLLALPYNRFVLDYHNEFQKWLTDVLGDEKNKKIQQFFKIKQQGSIEGKSDTILEMTDVLQKGINPSLISKYNKLLEQLLEYKRFYPDKQDYAGFAKKSFLESLKNGPTPEGEPIERLKANNYFLMGNRTWQKISYYIKHGTIVCRSRTIEKMKVNEENINCFIRDWYEGNDCTEKKIGDLVGNFFLFANRICKREDMERLLSIIDDVNLFEKAVYFVDKEKQKAAINMACDGVTGENTPERRQALELYFKLKDLYEGCKKELPEAYRAAKDQTLTEYGKARNEIKGIIVALLRMKKNFEAVLSGEKTAEEINGYYSQNEVERT